MMYPEYEDKYITWMKHPTRDTYFATMVGWSTKEREWVELIRTIEYTSILDIKRVAGQWSETAGLPLKEPEVIT